MTLAPIFSTPEPRTQNERYKAKSLPPRDLIHAAVMINGMSHIISADKHFDSIKEIKRMRPEQYARSIKG